MLGFVLIPVLLLSLVECRMVVTNYSRVFTGFNLFVCSYVPRVCCDRLVSELVGKSFVMFIFICMFFVRFRTTTVVLSVGVYTYSFIMCPNNALKNGLHAYRTSVLRSCRPLVHNSSCILVRWNTMDEGGEGTRRSKLLRVLVEE